jgi:hypothetical protein
MDPRDFRSSRLGRLLAFLAATLLVIAWGYEDEVRPAPAAASTGPH